MVETIHPNPAGPTKAESPYTRKLRRLIEDVKMTEGISPMEHKGTLTAVIFELEGLLNG